MDNFGIYRGPLGDLTWNQPGRIVTVNYESGRGWRYTRAMHETKWWNPADPERILANHVIMMSCPYTEEPRLFPELWCAQRWKRMYPLGTFGSKSPHGAP